MINLPSDRLNSWCQDLAGQIMCGTGSIYFFLSVEDVHKIKKGF